jgi:hypothetical protein
MSFILKSRRAFRLTACGCIMHYIQIYVEQYSTPIGFFSKIHHNVKSFIFGVKAFSRITYI